MTLRRSHSTKKHIQHFFVLKKNVIFTFKIYKNSNKFISNLILFEIKTYTFFLF